ncbi:MAG: nitrous oxide reductase accessory protein NosL [Geobacteraceae bacterium]|nr:nitrous oxide reductase accessory protein NosL [Geobacteraceae bacterium]
MKFFHTALIMFLLTATVAFAADKPVEAPADCKQCGMNRTKFAQSRMLITYSDGSSGTCSINCVAVDLKANKAKSVKSIQVGDYDNKKLIDAKTATWVIGGKQRGVMTQVPKWAFAEKSAAEKFIKVSGGKLATFDEALKAAESEQKPQGDHKDHGSHKM